MLLLDPTKGDQVQPPAICFVCEHHFDEHWRLVDTGMSFVMPEDRRAILTHLNGVKYICEHCAITAASTVMGTDLRDLANELVTLQADKAELELKLATYDGMDEEVLAQLRRVVENRTIPRNTRRPKPVEAE